VCVFAIVSVTVSAKNMCVCVGVFEFPRSLCTLCALCILPSSDLPSRLITLLSSGVLAEGERAGGGREIERERDRGRRDEATRRADEEERTER